jgi:lysophospholipase L1-like esterase
MSLSACGGGGSSAEATNKVIGVYGDSFSSPYAAEVIQANLVNTEVINYSVGGATTIDVLTGKWRPDQEVNKPFDNIEASLSTTEATTVLLRYGIAEAVLVGTGVFEANLLKIVDLAEKHNKEVILVNIPRLPNTHGIDQVLQDKFYQINTIIMRVAFVKKLQVVDLHRSMQLQRADMWSDGLHILPSATKKVSEEIARQL